MCTHTDTHKQRMSDTQDGGFLVGAHTHTTPEKQLTFKQQVSRRS